MTTTYEISHKLLESIQRIVHGYARQRNLPINEVIGDFSERIELKELFAIEERRISEEEQRERDHNEYERLKAKLYPSGGDDNNLGETEK